MDLARPSAWSPTIPGSPPGSPRHAERDVDLFDGEIVFEVELEML